jgi:hypothetical protein
MCAKPVEDLEIWQLGNELQEKTYALINASKKPGDVPSAVEIQRRLE